MKILRVRRGFTTNSSASSEWLPPEDEAAVSEGGVPGPVLPVPINIGFTPYSKVLLPLQPATPWANLSKGGGLVALVACVFIADRVWRRVRSRRLRADKKVSDDELE